MHDLHFELILVRTSRRKPWAKILAENGAQVAFSVLLPIDPESSPVPIVLKPAEIDLYPIAQAFRALAYGLDTGRFAVGTL